METIEIGGPDIVASRIALGTWAIGGWMWGGSDARSDLRRVDPKFQQPRFNQYLAAVSALDAFARKNFGKSALALAVRWVLDQGPTIALWGARRPEQVDAISEVTGWSLDEPSMREIDRILRDTITSPVGPEFMAPPQSVAESLVA